MYQFHSVCIHPLPSYGETYLLRTGCIHPLKWGDPTLVKFLLVWINCDLTSHSAAGALNSNHTRNTAVSVPLALQAATAACRSCLAAAAFPYALRALESRSSEGGGVTPGEVEGGLPKLVRGTLPHPTPLGVRCAFGVVERMGERK